MPPTSDRGKRKADEKTEMIRPDLAILQLLHGPLNAEDQGALAVSGTACLIIVRRVEFCGQTEGGSSLHSRVALVSMWY